jgi:hypothetical protein
VTRSVNGQGSAGYSSPRLDVSRALHSQVASIAIRSRPSCLNLDLSSAFRKVSAGDGYRAAVAGDEIHPDREPTS